MLGADWPRAGSVESPKRRAIKPGDKLAPRNAARYLTMMSALLLYAARATARFAVLVGRKMPTMPATGIGS